MLYHLPKNPLLQFICHHPVIFPKTYSSSPISNAAWVFTDGSSNGPAVTNIDNQPHVQTTKEVSAQKAELIAVLFAFSQLVDRSFNLHTDSCYIVKLFLHIETAVIASNKTTIFEYLKHYRISYISEEPHFMLATSEHIANYPDPFMEEML